VQRYLTRAPNARIGRVMSKKSLKTMRRIKASRGRDIARMPTMSAIKMIRLTKILIYIEFISYLRASIQRLTA
jgi:hypothetical protein